MPLDYRGGTRSGCYGLGASNRSERDREEDDFYATPYIATRRLLDKLKEMNISLPHHISEPAVGMGHIAKILEDNGYEVSAADIVDRKWPNTKIENFLESKSIDGDAIITNPPYKKSSDFVIHAMENLKEGQMCIMLLKIQFLEGGDRARRLYKNGLQPKYVLVFPERINCAKAGNFKEENGLFEGATKDLSWEEKDKLGPAESPKGGQIAYMWAIWEKGFKGMTQMTWL